MSLLVLIIGMIFSVSGCGFLTQDEVEEPLVVIGNLQLLELIEDGTHFFLYVGRPTCPFCAEFEPVLIETLRDQGKSIYYFNLDEAREENESKMIELATVLEVAGVPAMFRIENGQVVTMQGGVLSSEELIEFLEVYQ